MKCLWGLSLFYLVYITASGTTTNCPLQYLSYGDLKLQKSGLVLIYLGPDGTLGTARMWGTFDGEITTGRYMTPIKTTLCQQLGYKTAGAVAFKSTSESETYQTLISITGCTSSFSHILRCQHTLMNASNSIDKRKVLFLNCSNDLLRDDPIGLNAYQGQVLLFPPTNLCIESNTIRTSVSLGLVAYKDLDEWMCIKTEVDPDYLKEDIAVGRKEVDTICRAAGYTNAASNFLLSVGKAEYTFGYKFEHDFINTKLDLKNVQCGSQSFPCLHCCLHKKTYDLMVMRTDWSKAVLIIKCVFYNSTDSVLNEGGSEKLCEIADNDEPLNSDACKGTEAPTWMIIFLGTSPPLATFLVIFLILCTICRMTRQNRERHIGGNVGPPYRPLGDQAADNEGEGPNRAGNGGADHPFAVNRVGDADRPVANRAGNGGADRFAVNRAGNGGADHIAVNRAGNGGADHIAVNRAGNGGAGHFAVNRAGNNGADQLADNR